MGVAKDVLDELNEIGVMGGKVLPLPFVSPKQVEDQHPDTSELRERIDKLGVVFNKVLEKLDALEGDVLGLKLAFKEASEIWTGPTVEEEAQVDKEASDSEEVVAEAADSDSTEVEPDGEDASLADDEDAQDDDSGD